MKENQKQRKKKKEKRSDSVAKIFIYCVVRREKDKKYE